MRNWGWGTCESSNIIDYLLRILGLRGCSGRLGGFGLTFIYIHAFWTTCLTEFIRILTWTFPIVALSSNWTTPFLQFIGKGYFTTRAAHIILDVIFYDF